VNPWLAWLGPAAQLVKAQRVTAPADGALRKLEEMNAELTSAGLDYYRAVRDALAEAAFFTTYGNIYLGYLAEQPVAQQAADQALADPRERPVVRDALARIAEGGYAEAFARVGFLLARADEPIPLSLLTTAQDLIKDYADLLPPLPVDQWRRVRGEQEIIVRYDPERAIETLPRLLNDDEREHLLALIERVVNDKRVLERSPTEQQAAMLQRVRNALGGDGFSIRTEKVTARKRADVALR
jgi:hypothetical protein